MATYKRALEVVCIVLAGLNVLMIFLSLVLPSWRVVGYSFLGFTYENQYGLFKTCFTVVCGSVNGTGEYIIPR